MSSNLSLFEQPELEEHWTPPLPSTKTPKGADEGETPSLDLPLAHPYTRYGLAVALYLDKNLSLEEKQEPQNLAEDRLRAALAYALEIGLENFRMRTGDEPLFTRELNFAAIPLATLQSKTTLIQSAGLASQGIYIFPSVVTTDGDAKGTFDNSAALIAALRGKDASDSARKYSRSFAPTTAKINNGTASQSEPKGTLLETACAAIATLTPLKPAVWSERNTAIIPDIPIPELIDFIDLFERMKNSHIDGDLMQAKLPPLAPIKDDKPAATKAKKPKEGAKPKSDYRRPRLHNGNYPFAPRDATAFGAVGLLGAIGRWAIAAGEVGWATRVLESLADAPLYIISYDKIAQVHFGHHVVRLSIEAQLSEMLDVFYRETQLYASIDKALIPRQSPAYQLFYLQTSRFLQLFSRPAFRDFLAARAEYPAALKPLFQEYFLQDHMNIPPEVVHSAGVLGQWLNRTAFLVADGEYETGAQDRLAKVRKAKAKILVEFESAAMSAKSPQDLLFRISTRAGRLLQDDAPAPSKRFMDAVASGEISQQDAVHLLVAYMRLRAPRKDSGEPPTPATAPAENAPEPTTISDELAD